jgi:hypothetical protein
MVIIVIYKVGPEHLESYGPAWGLGTKAVPQRQRTPSRQGQQDKEGGSGDAVGTANGHSFHLPLGVAELTGQEATPT